MLISVSRIIACRNAEYTCNCTVCNVHIGLNKGIICCLKLISSIGFIDNWLVAVQSIFYILQYFVS